MRPTPASSPEPAPAAASPPSSSPPQRGEFLLVTCQGGAEGALSARFAELLPQATRAAWRRGIVTFRLGPLDPPDDFFPDAVYARSVIRSFGQVSGGDDDERITKLATLVGDTPFDTVHAWCRDPRTDVDVATIRGRLLAARGLPGDAPAAAAAGQLVLDCIVDGPDRWWVGWHRAAAPASRLPGGMHPVALPPDKVSRAWLKLDEAIALFGIPLAHGQRAVELGAAPGGASQRLLEAGLAVVGVDPALVDPRVTAHPAFEQWRMRARDVRLRMFRDFDWVVADMNIDPRSTLEAVERVVTGGAARVGGIIATLKLPDWSRAAELPDWLDRFRSFGFEPRARQLSTGGREICVVARRAAKRPRRAEVSRRATRPRDR